jgi:hypothetical protein
MAAYEYVGRKFGVSADIVGAEMEKIEKRDGEVTNRSLLEAGRPEDSALHGLFEWNDGKAAELYRLKQATDVITHIAIKVDGKPEEPYRAYVNIKLSDGQTESGRFINVQSAMENEETRKIVLSAALAEMKRFSNKYAKYRELSEVFEAIDKVSKELQEAS